MPRTEFIATGFYVPPRVVTNDELASLMDTSDEWIVQRTGIRRRHWVEPGTMCSALAAEATKIALARAGLQASDLDCIIFATTSPDHFFPGNGVFLQRMLGLTDIPALDVRDQCTGFIYGLSVADAWVRCGQYKRVLLVGAEIQSPGLDRSTGGRDTAVIFGDGAGVAILGPTDDVKRGVLSTHLFSDGRYAEKLWMDAPGLVHVPWIDGQMLQDGRARIRMEGREVFKHATTKMPESVQLALRTNGCTTADIKLLIPHQANLRISEMVQRQLDLRDDQVYNNIQEYGNTTAASIPIALDEALEQGRLARGDLLMLTAFGSGFTWGSAAVRW
jgi:3-oxoacyl-[acyl-carrier-protein] synthase-3